MDNIYRETLVEQVRQHRELGERMIAVLEAKDAQIGELSAALVAERDRVKALADALEHVHKASVNERVWNDATGKVDDMQKIVATALRLVGRL